MKIYKSYLILFTFVLLVLSGCTDNFEDLNTDKNQANETAYKPAYHLTRAQLEYSGNSDFSYETWRVNIIYASTMMQQLASASWYAGDKYQLNAGWTNAYFDVAYNDQVKYVVDMIKLTEGDAQYKNLHEIGRIMKAMIFHRITDIYGDVPYSEAGLGYHENILTPKYDTQEFIYKDMLKELDEATAALDVAADQPGGNDLIYGDEADAIAKWKKLGYSLMLRLAMRLTKADLATAKMYAEKAAAGGVFTSNADNASIRHDDTGNRNTKNRISNILGGEWNAVERGEIHLSKTLVDFLKDNNDPRLQYLAEIKGSGDATPANQIGLPNGYDQGGGATDISTEPNYPGSLNDYSTIRSEIFLSTTAPTFFITYAQTELLLAEAKERGFTIPGTAAEHYNNGVRAAMEYLAQYNAAATVSSADIDAYLAAHPYTGSLEQINTQYWAASFLDWYEVWANWRRSGFPNLVPVNYTGNATNGEIPRRMLYPASEAAINPTHLDEAIARQGANNLLTRVWWDQN
jgi:hypothetical protein